MAVYNKGNGKGITWIREHLNYAGDDCLPWPFTIDKRVGRGRVGFNGGMWWSHRLMCHLAHGPAPTRKHQTAHTCGNGHLGCMNPRHLEWKTNKENSIDRSAHGRGNRPGKYHRLSRQRVEQLKLRKGQLTQMAAAKEFGCSLSLVQYHWGGNERWPSHAKRT